MKKTILRMSVVAVVGVFSFAALAQVVDVRPDVDIGTRTDVRPDLKGADVKSNTQIDQMNSQFEGLRNPVQVKNQNVRCDLDSFASQAADGTDVSWADARAAADLLTNGTCGTASGFLGMKAQPRGNGLKIALQVKNDCQRDGVDIKNGAPKSYWIKAIQTVLGVSAADAETRLAELRSQCNFFRVSAN